MITLEQIIDLKLDLKVKFEYKLPYSLVNIVGRLFCEETSFDKHIYVLHNNWEGKGATPVVPLCKIYNGEYLYSRSIYRKPLDNLNTFEFRHHKMTLQLLLGKSNIFVIKTS